MRRWLSFILLVFATLAFGHELEMRMVPTDLQTPVFHRNFPDVEAKPIPYFYNPFSNLISRTGDTPNNYLYCGEQYDSDLGLYYNRARYLNTDSGRFWTRDPAYGFLEEPPTLHKYIYTAGNPIDFVDPSGRWTLTEITVASSTSGFLAGLTAPYILHRNGNYATPIECCEACMYDSGTLIASVGVALGMPAASLPVRKLFHGAIGPERYTTLLSIIDLYYQSEGAALRNAGRFLKPYATPLFYSSLSYIGGVAISCSVKCGCWD
jgi:RHS repeat-associated protein